MKLLKKRTLISSAVLTLILTACGGGSDSKDINPPVNPGTPTTPVDPTDNIPGNTVWKLNVINKNTVNANNLYVVANNNDPTSLILAKEYMTKRGIPDTNLILVTLPVKMEISKGEAVPLLNAINNATNAKAFVMAWTQPYRVGANQSITSYVSNGPVNDAIFTTTCNTTPSSNYYNSGFTIGKGSQVINSNIKPAMLLASFTSVNGNNVIDPTVFVNNQADNSGNTISSYLVGARRLIDIGIKADDKEYTGTAYFLKTSDSVRSGRYEAQQVTANTYKNSLNFSTMIQDSLGGKNDILIYQTGLAKFDPSENGMNTYLPGSIADTLTSFSGRLYDSGGQMSALEFLKAGATASYGTVREPCSFSSKFPESSAYVSHLLSGDTLIEAYSKSVQLPTEGLFIGEPLARPYGKMKVTNNNGEVFLENRGTEEGIYTITYNGKTINNGVTLKQGQKVSIGRVAPIAGVEPLLIVTKQ